MEASINCINLCAGWEDFSSHPYQDSIGIWTQGFGHTEGVNQLSLPITLEQGYVWLKSDILNAEYGVNLFLKGKSLRQCQYDALVSLVFNIGIGTFSKSNLYKQIMKDEDSHVISDEWIEFRNAGGKYHRGLLRRRIDELALYYSW